MIQTKNEKKIGHKRYEKFDGLHGMNEALVGVGVDVAALSTK